MTLLVLIAGIVLWVATTGTLHTVGEALTIIGAVLVALQLIFTLVVGSHVRKAFRDF